MDTVCSHCGQPQGDHIHGEGCNPDLLAEAKAEPKGQTVFEWISGNVTTFFELWNKCPDFIRLKPEVHSDLMMELSELRRYENADPPNPGAYNEVKLNFGVGSVKVVMDPAMNGTVDGQLVKLGEMGRGLAIEEIVMPLTPYVPPKGKTLAEVFAEPIPEDEPLPVERLTNRDFARRFQSEKDR